MNFLRNKIFIIFILASIGLWFIGINDPFVGAYSANLNYFTLAAKNFARIGYLKLGFVPTYYAGEVSEYVSQPYLHHPVSYFTLVSIPFLIFGFHNWIASITPVIFSLFSLIFLYKICKTLWNEKTALLAVFLFSVFPMSAVFNKQTIFEPAVTAVLLSSYYFYIKYLKSGRWRNLILFFLSSLLSILIDWGGVYFIFPLVILFPFLNPNNRSAKAVKIYVLAACLGIMVFILQVLYWRGGFEDLISAVWVRQVDSELFSGEYPILRYILTVVFRILIYFTPFSILVLVLLKQHIQEFFKKKELSLQSYTIFFFLIFGLVNFIILPTATFGHIYFLIYLTPFFSISLSLILLTRFGKSDTLIYFIMTLILILSSVVVYSKWQQVNKQIYKYDAGLKINQQLKPFQTVAVYEYPGDMLEQYFFHPTVNMTSFIDLIDYLDEDLEKDRVAIYSCWGTCSSEEMEFISNIHYHKIQFAKDIWLITSDIQDVSLYDSQNKAAIEENSLESATSFINYYRYIRDFLRVGQL
ncbi:glycosyltransferase family 39 protein [Candidatus Gottesmanbacteria bacterium]|nr:glycosyltransferase family 39 protein [Candidatus Gottesmanbacteria bacterium]